MPFKTKKQKLKASKKRVTILAGGIAAYQTTNVSHAKETPSSTIDALYKEEANTDNYSHIKGEIMKVAILALVIIGLQIFLKMAFS